MLRVTAGWMHPFDLVFCFLADKHTVPKITIPRNKKQKIPALIFSVKRYLSTLPTFDNVPVPLLPLAGAIL